MSQKLTVKDVMSKPVSIAKSALIPEALSKMLENGIDPIVVTHDHVVVGTASRRTIAEKMGSKKTGNIPASQIRVATVTREDFTSVYPDQDFELLIPLLQKYKIETTVGFPLGNGFVTYVQQFSQLFLCHILFFT